MSAEPPRDAGGRGIPPDTKGPYDADGVPVGIGPTAPDSRKKPEGDLDGGEDE